MTILNSDDIIQKPNKEVDPNFSLPPGVSTVQYSDTDDRTTVMVEDGDGDLITVIYDEVISSDIPVFLETAVLQPPTYANVVTQTIYVAPDGRFAVDVTLDVEDIPGVQNYDVRVSKV